MRKPSTHATMSVASSTSFPSSSRPLTIRLLAIVLLALAPLIVFVPSAANACACGCSVFDVGGGLLPQEDDHGGRVFTEWWHASQNRNWIGSSRGPADANNDKRVVTDWVTAGLQYMFNREWGISIRVPYVSRAFTTDTGAPPDGAGIQTFNSRSIGDIEIMGMYTGFSSDMSTGIIFGLKLPTGTFTAQGLDRDTQIGSGSTDLILGAFHRGMISGDNAWQYFTQVRWLQPFLYQSAYNADANAVLLYKPGYQIDGAAGVVYNNLYNVAGFDKIAPLLQIIVSHRQRDSGPAADPLNSGFDRIMISPGIEFTKVVDEVNKRVLKFYVDVEIPIFYRANAAINDNGSMGQLIAPYLIKTVASYNF
ncbi:hypothetical protein [Bradyrhizobium sp. 2TAF24]|uniref:hypothetical protein n=1 Tax=Bradyrhizobium sp. 2TAF24 TaxID=3233011 RepID=UPI003F91FE95